eukprot:9053891-Alexandrium_andersonii.AAC.1
MGCCSRCSKTVQSSASVNSQAGRVQPEQTSSDAGADARGDGGGCKGKRSTVAGAAVHEAPKRARAKRSATSSDTHEPGQ